MNKKRITCIPNNAFHLNTFTKTYIFSCHNIYRRFLSIKKFVEHFGKERVQIYKRGSIFQLYYRMLALKYIHTHTHILFDELSVLSSKWLLDIFIFWINFFEFLILFLRNYIETHGRTINEMENIFREASIFNFL